MMLLSSVSSRFSWVILCRNHCLKKVFINNMRLYCSLDDFITFTKYPGFDPESSANATTGMGIDMGGYPASKKVVLGFNIEF